MPVRLYVLTSKDVTGCSQDRLPLLDFQFSTSSYLERDVTGRFTGMAQPTVAIALDIFRVRFYLQWIGEHTYIGVDEARALWKERHTYD